MDLKNLNLSDFVRYILTGFNFVLFVIVLPLIYFLPDQVVNVVSTSSFLTIALLSIAIGYLMDILKLYKLSPKHAQKKDRFMIRIAELLEIPLEQASSFFSLTSSLSKKYGAYELERRRSEWVLITHTAVTLIVSTVVWIYGGISQFKENGIWLQLGLPIFAVIMSILLSVRLYKIAARERQKDDQDFFIVLQENKQQILDGWKFRKSENEKSNKESS